MNNSNDRSYSSIKRSFLQFYKIVVEMLKTSRYNLKHCLQSIKKQGILKRSVTPPTQVYYFTCTHGFDTCFQHFLGSPIEMQDIILPAYKFHILSLPIHQNSITTDKLFFFPKYRSSGRCAVMHCEDVPEMLYDIIVVGSNHTI